jgi:hypothetical protein
VRRHVRNNVLWTMYERWGHEEPRELPIMWAQRPPVFPWPVRMAAALAVILAVLAAVLR